MSIVAIKVPQELLGGIQAIDPNKPYDLCLHCEFLEESCDGPNIVAMEYTRWIEWANKLAHQRGLTRAQIAEQSGVPKSTIDSVLSGRTSDIRHSTLQAITRTVVGGCWGRYPCHLASLLMQSEELRVDEQIAALKKELEEERGKNADLRNQLHEAKSLHEKELATVREDAQRKTDWLKERSKVLDGYISDHQRSIEHRDRVIERKERTIAALCVVVALLGSFIIGALIYDKLHPDVGWLRAEPTSYVMYPS